MKALYLIAIYLLTACKGVHPDPRDATFASYFVSIDDNNPYSAQVSLTLENNGETPTRLISRAQSLGTTSQIKDVKCSDGSMVPHKDNMWSIPSDCSAVTWNINIDDAKSSFVQPSQQRSLYMPSGWWMFSAPTSLLRLESQLNDIPVNFVISKSSAVKKTLRKITEPPNFYVLGSAPSKSASSGNVGLTYYGDNLDTLFEIIDLAKHQEAIAYFNTIIGRESSRLVSDLSVVWFGVARDRREISGAAGYDTILANFIIPEDNPRVDEQLMSLMLVLHEQFHQLDSGSHPVWFGESLANYYALKALKKIFPDNDSVNMIWNRFIDIDRPKTLGLLDIETQISQDQNRQNYGLLYTQGATFWSEVDTAIKQHSSHGESLDSYMPRLMGVDMTSEAASFAKIEKLLSVIPPSEMEQVKVKYLN